MSILWTILIGFVAGLIAKLIYRSDNEPSGFILTTVLGIVGAVVARLIFDTFGWFQPGDSIGLLGSVFGAVVVLAIWGFVSKRTT